MHIVTLSLSENSLTSCLVNFHLLLFYAASPLSLSKGLIDFPEESLCFCELHQLGKGLNTGIDFI